MKERTYEHNEYWNRTYSSEEYFQEENVVREGNDGEEEFAVKVLNRIDGKVILDVGCGDGIFTIRMADRAKHIYGVDFSKLEISDVKSILDKSGKRNIRFTVADARKLPFDDETFDFVISRRGPVTDNLRTLSEAYRVLRKGGYLMEITIGEKDKINLKQIF